MTTSQPDNATTLESKSVLCRVGKCCSGMQHAGQHSPSLQLEVTSKACTALVLALLMRPAATGKPHGVCGAVVLRGYC